jgi:hypothetical protein
MRDIDDVPGRSQDNPLAASITASPLTDQTWGGADIRLNFRNRSGFADFVDHNLFGTFSGHLGRIFGNQLLFDSRSIHLSFHGIYGNRLHRFFSFGIFHASSSTSSPVSPVRTRTASMHGKT